MMIVLAKASRAHGGEKKVVLVLVLFLSSLWRKPQRMNQHLYPTQAVAKFEVIWLMLVWRILYGPILTMTRRYLVPVPTIHLSSDSENENY